MQFLNLANGRKKTDQFSVVSFTIYISNIESMAKQSEQDQLSEVEQIVKNTKKEEIRRRMSHGELLRGFNNGNGVNINGSNNGSFNGSNNGSFNGFNNGMNNGSFTGSDAQSTNGEEEKTVFFDAQVRNHQIIVVLKTTGKGNDCLNIAKKNLKQKLPYKTSFR